MVRRCPVWTESRTLENFVEEQEFWDNWMDSDALRYAQETWEEYAEGSPTFHRYNVLHSY